MRIPYVSLRCPPCVRVAACLMASAAFFAACGKEAQNAATNPAATGPAPVPVTLASVRSMELQRTVKITGSLVGLETATLSNRVSGLVTKIYFDRGDRIRPGDLLLEIEPDRYRMALDESRAGLQGTLARLGLEEIPGEDFDIAQTAPVKKAQSDYENAKAKYDRATPLAQSKVMNDFEYLDIVSAYKAASSVLENSRDEARALLAQARQNRSQLQMRQKDFTDSRILAPDGQTPDGRRIDSYAIVDRKISVGEYLREGSPLFTIVADRTLRLQSHVPERYLGDVKKDAAVTFAVEAFPGETFEGRVGIIDPSVDPASRTFRIEAIVDNTRYGNRLRPGSFVPGEVLTKKEPNRIMVPLTAITSFVGVTKLFKVDSSTTPPTVKAIVVTPGQSEVLKDATGKDEHWVEILSAEQAGVNANDQVATSGLTKLVNGSKINVRTPETAPAAAAAAH